MTGFPVCCRVSSWDPDFSLFAHQGCFGWDFFSFWISQWLVGHQLFTLLDVACPGCPKTASKRLALKAYALGWYENNDKKMDARYMCSTASNFPKNSLACHVSVPVMPGKGPRNACVKKRMTRIESRRILFGEMWEVGSWIYWSDVVELLTLTFAGKSGAMYTLYGKFEAWRFGCWVTESWCRCKHCDLRESLQPFFDHMEWARNFLDYFSKFQSSKFQSLLSNNKLTQHPWVPQESTTATPSAFHLHWGKKFFRKDAVMSVSPHACPKVRVVPAENHAIGRGIFAGEVHVCRGSKSLHSSWSGARECFLILQCYKSCM